MSLRKTLVLVFRTLREGGNGGLGCLGNSVNSAFLTSFCYQATTEVLQVAVKDGSLDESSSNGGCNFEISFLQEKACVLVPSIFVFCFLLFMEV